MYLKERKREGEREKEMIIKTNDQTVQPTKITTKNLKRFKIKAFDL